MELTNDQVEAIDSGVEFIRRSRGRLATFAIGGYAGTGKSTVLSAIMDRLSGGMPCSFTGKAADVMRRKGIGNAETIHRTIYRYDESRDRFELKKASDVRNGMFFAVDEASMVSRELWEDMRSFDLPILLVGDPGQLEPVGNDPNLMQSPDVILNSIHRQAAGNPIIELANNIRCGGLFERTDKDELKIGGKDLFWDSVGIADHLLCGFNKTRIKANNEYRKRANKSGVIQDGERLIVLGNDRDLGVWNGMMLDVVSVKRQPKKSDRIPHAIADVVRDGSSEVTELAIYTEQIGNPNKIDFPMSRIVSANQMAIVDYGYCTTVHKFQGSEADSVAVLDEQCSVWSPIRWRYTAITRAAKRLLYAV